MEQKNVNQKNQAGYVIIPHETLETIERNQVEILELLKGKSSPGSEQLNYVDEKKAIQIIGKKATWFWQMRKTGVLKYTKVGAKVFYSLDALKKLVNEGGGN